MGSSEISTEEAKRLIESGYTVLPDSMKREPFKTLANFQSERQTIKNSFLLGYGESVIMDLIDQIENKET